MNIEITLNGNNDKINNAFALIRVVDTSNADAPSKEHFSTIIGPFSIHSTQNRISFEVDFCLPNEKHNLSLFIKVDGQTGKNKQIKFINTTTVPLIGDRKKPIRVLVERVN